MKVEDLSDDRYEVYRVLCETRDRQELETLTRMLPHCSREEILRQACERGLRDMLIERKRGAIDGKL